jgi:hypothetical protein
MSLRVLLKAFRNGGAGRSKSVEKRHFRKSRVRGKRERWR